MWKVVHAHSDELEVIDDALKEGFEPFAVDGGRMFLMMQVDGDKAGIEDRCTEPKLEMQMPEKNLSDAP